MIISFSLIETYDSPVDLFVFYELLTPLQTVRNDSKLIDPLFYYYFKI